MPGNLSSSHLTNWPMRIQRVALILEVAVEAQQQFQFRENEMASSSLMENLSNELSAAAEQVGQAVVAVQGRHRISSSGIQWRKGVVVTADHAIGREEDVRALLGPGKSVGATVAGRDSSTDLAVLTLENQSGLALPEFVDTSALKLANLALALARSRRGHLVASMGIIGGLAGEWRTGGRGKLDLHVRLDLELYPGFSGGPLVTSQGKVAGINTSGLSRGRAVTIPVTTVNRVVDELLEKGHIARPYLGLAMQPVGISDSLRSKLKSAVNSGLLVMHVEAGGPADKAGVLLGDVLIGLQGKPLEELDTIQDLLYSDKVGDKVAVTAIRGGEQVQLSLTLGERPAR
jgi:serine protease DegQ